MRTNMPLTGREVKFLAGERLISATDKKGRIIYCNEEFCRVSGFSREELVGAPHNIVRHPDMPPEVFGHMWQHLSAGMCWMGVVKNRCKNGDHYYVNAYVTPVFEKGELAGYESVRVLPLESEVARAELLYQRIREGKPSLSARVSWARAALPLAAALFFMSGLLMGWQESAWFSVVLFLVLLAAWAAGDYQRSSSDRRLLESLKGAFDSPLMAQVYSAESGATARIHTAVISERAKLNTVLSRLGDFSGQASEKAGKSSALIVQVSELVQEQKGKTQMVESALHGVSQSVETVVGTIHRTAEETGGVRRLSEQAKSQAGQTRHLMNQLRASVDATNQAVSELVGALSEVAGAANVIDNIAEQTSLLALNAAIEAARAGDSGRGFAVVADEVRALAASTQGSTQAIQEVMQRLNGHADQAVRTADSTCRDVAEGVDGVEATESALIAIAGILDQIDSMTGQLVSAVEEQGTSINDITQQSADVLQAALGIEDAARESTLVGCDLQQSVESLRSLVDRFNA